MEKLSVSELKKVVMVAGVLGTIGGLSAENGKIGMEDLAHLPKLIPVFPALVSVQWSQVAPQAKDLDLEEANELVSEFEKYFDIPQDALESKVEFVINATVKLASVIAELVAAVKKPV